MTADLETPTLEAITRAALRIDQYIYRTPVLQSDHLNQLTGANLYFKCENLQRSGAFKFRGACNAVWSLDPMTAKPGVITHSSGNHGAALALAAGTRNIPAHVVIPQGSVPSKIAAISAYGGTVHLCEPTLQARDATAQRVCAETGTHFVHPYTDAAVIAGQGTAALELLQDIADLDAIITPVGGGGLIGGTSIAAQGGFPKIALYAAEPEGANDAWESLRRGERVTTLVPNTICDGLRALIGAINFKLLQQYRVTVLPVSDTETLQAMRLVWERLKLVIEPSSATVMAAILRYREHFADQRVGVILSGGNLDLHQLPW